MWKAKRLRPAPNPSLRGSLFGLVKRGEEIMLKDLEVYRDKNLSIVYNGPSLSQSDMDVWLYIMQVAGQRFLDPDVSELSLEFSITAFLNEIGRKGTRSGGRNKDWLLASLTRMAGSTLTVKTPDNAKGVMGTLIQGAAWDDVKNKLVVKVNAQIGYMFSSQITMLSVDVRTRLMGDDLALWLYNFILSNKNPMGPMVYGLERIMVRCRTQAKAKRTFKSRVSQKMAKLMDVDEKDRGFNDWVFEGDNLHVFYTHAQKEMWDRTHPATS